MPVSEPSIAALAVADLGVHREALCALLADAIDGNASVGYVWPTEAAQVEAYWEGSAADVARGERVVLAAFVGEALAGCVHVAPSPKPNQRHRADIQKLLVHRRYRRRGIARALMRAAEAHALRLGRTLLTLDTRTGSAADVLYRGLGWTAFGIVPGYARDPDGRLADCTFFYKRLVG